MESSDFNHVCDNAMGNLPSTLQSQGKFRLSISDRYAGSLCRLAHVRRMCAHKKLGGFLSWSIFDKAREMFCRCHIRSLH